MAWWKRGGKRAERGPSDGPNMIPLAEMENLLRRLMAIDAIVKLLAANKVVHRVSSWGNQLSLRVHLAWR